MSTSTYWYSPDYELDYGGERLIEPGEVFRLRQHFHADDKMEAIGQVTRVSLRDMRRLRKCDNCGKRFVDKIFYRSKRSYYLTHRIIGCGRKREQQLFYGLEDTLKEAGLES